MKFQEMYPGELSPSELITHLLWDLTRIGFQFCYHIGDEFVLNEPTGNFQIKIQKNPSVYLVRNTGGATLSVFAVPGNGEVATLEYVIGSMPKIKAIWYDTKIETTPLKTFFTKLEKLKKLGK